MTQPRLDHDSTAESWSNLGSSQPTTGCRANQNFYYNLYAMSEKTAFKKKKEIVNIYKREREIVLISPTKMPALSPIGGG